MDGCRAFIVVVLIATFELSPNTGDSPLIVTRTTPLAAPEASNSAAQAAQAAPSPYAAAVGGGGDSQLTRGAAKIRCARLIGKT